MRDAFGGGMRAVCGRECIVDEDVAKRRHLLGERRIVFFFACVKAGVLKQQHVAVFHAWRRPACATSPTQSSANATGRPIAFASGAAMGFSDIEGTTLPLGRSKWESTITRAPFSASSRMVGAWRSMRVASVTRAVLHRHVQIGAHQNALSRLRRDRRACGMRPRSEQFPHRDGDVGHAVRKAPFVVVPAHHPHQIAFDNLGLVERERRRCGIVIEVVRDERRIDDVEHAFQFAATPRASWRR